jgi:hypothetical protein
MKWFASSFVIPIAAKTTANVSFAPSTGSPQRVFQPVGMADMLDAFIIKRAVEIAQKPAEKKAKPKDKELLCLDGNIIDADYIKRILILICKIPSLLMYCKWHQNLFLWI